MAGIGTRSKSRRHTDVHYDKYLGDACEDPDGFETKFINAEIGRKILSCSFKNQKEIVNLL